MPILNEEEKGVSYNLSDAPRIHRIVLQGFPLACQDQLSPTSVVHGT